MFYKAFLIKYGEIGIKGKNRYLFEDALMRQIQFALRDCGEFDVTKEQGRIYVDALTDYDYDEVIEALKRVFGIVAICPVVHCEDNSWENLTLAAVSYTHLVLRPEPAHRVQVRILEQTHLTRTTMML